MTEYSPHFRIFCRSSDRILDMILVKVAGGLVIEVVTGGDFPVIFCHLNDVKSDLKRRIKQISKHGGTTEDRFASVCL